MLLQKKNIYLPTYPTSKFSVGLGETYQLLSLGINYDKTICFQFLTMFLQGKVQRLFFLTLQKQGNVLVYPLQRLARGWYDYITNLTYLPECHLRNIKLTFITFYSQIICCLFYLNNRCILFVILVYV